MIAFFYGTSAELIKLAPIMRRLQERNVSYQQWVTGQHAAQLDDLTKELGLTPIDYWLSKGVNGSDLVKSSDVPKWFFGLIWNLIKNFFKLKKELKKDGKHRVVVVHGDTMTTPVGAFYGRILGAKVAHVEAGMRSFDLRNPFPEEIDRRITAWFAHVHYAPGDEPSHNVRKRGIVVNTKHNTVRDSIDLAIEAGTILDIEKPYGIVSLHRQELLANKDVFIKTIRYLIKLASNRNTIFIEHNVTVEAMKRYDIFDEYKKSNLIQKPRMSYFDFMSALSCCEFLFTDSGGGQQETYFLNKPCLVHRLATETKDGEGECMVLSKFNFETVDSFFLNLSKYKRKNDLPDKRPSDIVVEDMLQRVWI